MGDFLRQGAIPRRALAALAAGGGPAGRRLGPYELRRLLGEGGMGTVYLADRADDAYHKQVAIKVAHGLASPELLHRFRRERQILAGLEHPNIARLLDGGATPEGLPYLVMEYVEGVAIDRYCEEHQLSVPARLELFLEVCGAVGHAHHNLVVHRDLKPGNILIGAGGAPKLLDFGIAELLDGTAAAGGEVAGAGSGLRPLTPSFASPEQLRGDAVTTATDVYSLGVVLYLLLTGRLPRHLEALDPAAVERALEPPPPPPGVDRELDSIVLRALATDPEDRYPSVEQLMGELRRYGAGQPVEAFGGSFAYRSAKFLGRHRWPVLAVTGLFCLLALLLTSEVLRSGQLARERDRARAEQAKAQELSGFLVQLLQGSDPFRNGGEEVSVGALLERGAERIQRGFREQPEVRARLLDTIGFILVERGRYRRGRELLEAALSERLRIFGPDHPETAASWQHLGELAVRRSEFGTAEEHFARALGIRLKALGPDSLEVAETRLSQGAALLSQGRLLAAEGPLTEGFELRRRHLGEGHPKVAQAEVQLALLDRTSGRLAQAEAGLRRALAVQRRRLGPRDLEVASTLASLAGVLGRRGEAEAAGELLREALAIQRQLLGEEHLQVVLSLNMLAGVELDRGRLQAAEAQARRALQVALLHAAPTSRVAGVLTHNLARVLRAQGDVEGAERLWRRIVGGLADAGPADGSCTTYPDAAQPLYELALIEFDRHDCGTAERILESARAIAAGGLPASHPVFGQIRSLRGACHLRRGEAVRAAALLQEGLDHLIAAFGADHREVARVRAWVEELEELQGPSSAASGSLRP